jgi:NADP-dependent 3-hydroxy acid dehydrogenase YdfG
MPVIIVTGASRGIGYAILERFAKAGWDLCFCSKDKLQVSKSKDYLARTYPSISIYSQTLDVSDEMLVRDFGKKCLEKFGNIDVLVNNAGVYTPGTISEADAGDNLEHLMKINLYSAYWLGKEIIPSMVAKSCGHIFNICSIAGLEAYPNGGSYAITKFALQGYTRTIRQELMTKSVRVTGVYPGAVLTDSWSGTDHPSSRFITPADIAEVVFSSHHITHSAVVEDIVIRPQLGDI